VWQTGTNRRIWHVSKTPEQKQQLIKVDEANSNSTDHTENNLFDKSDECDIPRASTAEEDLISMYEEAQNPKNLDEDEPF
jgi:hypothetical protein